MKNRSPLDLWNQEQLQVKLNVFIAHYSLIWIFTHKNLRTLNSFLKNTFALLFSSFLVNILGFPTQMNLIARNSVIIARK